MAKVKIQTVNIGKFGKSFNYTPEVGVICFDKDGYADIEEEHVDSVVGMDNTISLAGEVKIVDLNPKGGKEDINEYKRELNKMKKEELLQLAVEAGLPQEEYGELNKIKLIDYLFEKTQEQE